MVVSEKEHPETRWEFLAIATGRNLLGITPHERTRVLYWNGDDPLVEVERRISAIYELTTSMRRNS